MEEARSQNNADSGEHQSPPSELDIYIRTVGGKKKGRVYGLGLESTTLAGISNFHGQPSSCIPWFNSKEFQEEMKKQVETEVHARVQEQMQKQVESEVNARVQEQMKKLESDVNARVQAAEQERDELRRQLENHGKMLQDIMNNINFQPSATPATPDFSDVPTQLPVVDPYYQRYRRKGSHSRAHEHNPEEDEDDEAED